MTEEEQRPSSALGRIEDGPAQGGYTFNFIFTYTFNHGILYLMLRTCCARMKKNMFFGENKYDL